MPWVAVSDILDIAPVLTYASNDLWNWKLKDPKGPFELEYVSTLPTLSNLIPLLYLRYQILNSDLSLGISLSHPLIFSLSSDAAFNSNLETLFTMTGTKDEDWFDIVSTAIEIAAGPAYQALIDSIHSVRRDNIRAVIENLHLAHTQLDKISKLLRKFLLSTHLFLLCSTK